MGPPSRWPCGSMRPARQRAIADRDPNRCAAFHARDSGPGLVIMMLDWDPSARSLEATAAQELAWATFIRWSPIKWSECARHARYSSSEEKLTKAKRRPLVPFFSTLTSNPPHSAK